MPDGASHRQSAPSWTRTKNLLIKSQLQTCENPGKPAHSDNCAAAGAAVETVAATLDPDLQSVIEQWPDLPPAVKAGIVAMVRASGTISNNGTETGSRAWTPR